MILTDEEINERLDSPLNLLNRLKVLTNDSSGKSPCLPPTADELVSELNEKIRNGTAKSKALSIMLTAMDELSIRLPSVQKPERLAAIAAEMNKVVNAPNNNKNEERSDKPQIIIYAPQVTQENNYETMTINE